MIKCLLSFSLSLWSSQILRTQNKQTTSVSEKKKKASSFSLSLSLWFCVRACVCVLSKRALSSEEDEMILFVSNVSFFPSFLFEEEKKRKRKSRRLEISSFIIKAPPNERVFSCERDFLFFFFCSLAREKWRGIWRRRRRRRRIRSFLSCFAQKQTFIREKKTRKPRQHTCA